MKKNMITYFGKAVSDLELERMAIIRGRKNEL